MQESALLTLQPQGYGRGLGRQCSCSLYCRAQLLAQGQTVTGMQCEVLDMVMVNPFSILV
ncbi:MAG: hypothetical protein RR387_00185 [Clostridiales bacterium]